MEARIYANKAPTSSETAHIFLPEMLRTKICTVGDWCYLGTVPDGTVVVQPKQISVKKFKFVHKNKDIDKEDKGEIFWAEGGFFWYCIQHCF
jgi:hypothetical protein